MNSICHNVGAYFIVLGSSWLTEDQRPWRSYIYPWCYRKDILFHTSIIFTLVCALNFYLFSSVIILQRLLGRHVMDHQPLIAPIYFLSLLPYSKVLKKQQESQNNSSLAEILYIDKKCIRIMLTEDWYDLYLSNEYTNIKESHFVLMHLQFSNCP